VSISPVKKTAGHITLLCCALVIFLLTTGCVDRTIPSGQANPSDAVAAARSQSLAYMIQQAREAREAKIRALIEQPARQPVLVEKSLREPARQSPRRDDLFGNVFFDYNKYAIKSEYLDRLRQQAAWLREREQDTLLIEGYCDERGSQAYNLILGRKRAEAVKDLLVKFGAEASRIRTMSYGKENPVERSHNETAWSHNRRVRFVLNSDATSM